MFSKLLNAIFGCSHNHYSFPRSARRGTLRGTAAAKLTGTYVVCLDCGKELPYDWQAMKVVNSVAESRKYLRALATKAAS